MQINTQQAQMEKKALLQLINKQKFHIFACTNCYSVAKLVFFFSLPSFLLWRTRVKRFFECDTWSKMPHFINSVNQHVKRDYFSIERRKITDWNIDSGSFSSCDSFLCSSCMISNIMTEKKKTKTNENYIHICFIDIANKSWALLAHTVNSILIKHFKRFCRIFHSHQIILSITIPIKAKRKHFHSFDDLSHSMHWSHNT